MEDTNKISGINRLTLQKNALVSLTQQLHQRLNNGNGVAGYKNSLEFDNMSPVKKDESYEPQFLIKMPSGLADALRVTSGQPDTERLTNQVIKVIENEFKYSSLTVSEVKRLIYLMDVDIVSIEANLCLVLTDDYKLICQDISTEQVISMEDAADRFYADNEDEDEFAASKLF